MVQLERVLAILRQMENNARAAADAGSGQIHARPQARIVLTRKLGSG